MTTKLFINGEFVGNVVMYFQSKLLRDGWYFKFDDGTVIKILYKQIKYFSSCDYLNIITKEEE